MRPSGSRIHVSQNCTQNIFLRIKDILRFYFRVREIYGCSHFCLLKVICNRRDVIDCVVIGPIVAVGIHQTHVVVPFREMLYVHKPGFGYCQKIKNPVSQTDETFYLVGDESKLAEVRGDGFRSGDRLFGKTVGVGVHDVPPPVWSSRARTSQNLASSGLTV